MGWRDTAQICMNGHVVNDSVRSSPEFNSPFCKDCGAPTITECQTCKQPIPGDYQDSGVIVVGGGIMGAPPHCRSCGAPYPWTVKRNMLGARVMRAAVGIGRKLSVAFAEFLSLVVDTSLGQTAIAIILAAASLILPSKITLVVAMVVAGLLLIRSAYRPEHKFARVLRTSIVIGLALVFISVVVWRNREVHPASQPPKTGSTAPSAKFPEKTEVTKTDAAKIEPTNNAAKKVDSGSDKQEPGKHSELKIPKTSGRETNAASKTQARQTQINNAPNGIAIGGGTVTNPTVNNSSYGIFPPPGVVPNISICFVSRNELKGQFYETIFTMKTDQPISSPGWMLLFDNPINDKTTAEIKPTLPFMTTIGRPRKEYVSQPENALVLGADNFGGLGSQAPWRPDYELKVTVKSPKPVALVSVQGWSVQEHLDEKFSYPCGR